MSNSVTDQSAPLRKFRTIDEVALRLRPDREDFLTGCPRAEVTVYVVPDDVYIEDMDDVAQMLFGMNRGDGQYTALDWSEWREGAAEVQPPVFPADGQFDDGTVEIGGLPTPAHRTYCLLYTSPSPRD